MGFHGFCLNPSAHVEIKRAPYDKDPLPGDSILQVLEVPRTSMTLNQRACNPLNFLGNPIFVPENLVKHTAFF